MSPHRTSLISFLLIAFLLIAGNRHTPMNPLENASRPVPPKAFTSILKGSSGHGAMSPTAKRKASNPSKSWTTPKAYRPPLASVTHTPSKKTARPGHGETTPSARSCRTPIPRPPTSPDPSKSWITSASSNPATPPSSPSKTTTPCGVGAHPAAGVATSIHANSSVPSKVLDNVAHGQHLHLAHHRRR